MPQEEIQIDSALLCEQEIHLEPLEEPVTAGKKHLWAETVVFQNNIPMMCKVFVKVKSAAKVKAKGKAQAATVPAEGLPCDFGPILFSLAMAYNDWLSWVAQLIDTTIDNLEGCSMKWKFNLPSRTPFLPISNKEGLKALLTVCTILSRVKTNCLTSISLNLLSEPKVSISFMLLGSYAHIDIRIGLTVQNYLLCYIQEAHLKAVLTQM